MNKEAALQRVTALETELAALRKVINGPESLLDPTEKQVEFKFRVPESRTGQYYTAIKTLIELRMQPGTRAPDAAGNVNSGNVNSGNLNSGTLRYFIEPHWSTSEGRWLIKVQAYAGTATKLARISPAFESEQHAKKAVLVLSEPRLLAMFYDLHHFG